MHIENISVGDYLVVVGRCGQLGQEMTESQELFGGPVRVRGACAPYLAISDMREPKRVRTLDLRLWEVSKADPEYVKVFEQAEEFDPIQEDIFPLVQNRCPVCDVGRFVKVYARGQEPHWRCSECRSVIVEESYQL
jgi:hypothetical protein